MMRATLRSRLVVAILFSGCAEEPDRSPLRLAEAARRDIVVSAIAAGVVEPVTTVEVKSKASGEIVEVAVEEGDEVRTGQTLVRVDPRIPENAVIQAEADSVVARAELDNAQAQLARAEALHRSQAITELELENARLARATAYAALVRARRALEDAKIAYEDTDVRAPSDGIILGRAVEVGTVIASASRDVSGGAVLLRMATLDTVQVRALVDETDIGMVSPSMPVTIQVASFPSRAFEGEVLRIGAEAVVQQNVTMFPVLIRIANLERLLRPGMNAEVQVHIGEARDVVAVPNAALRTFEDGPVAAEVLGIAPESLPPPRRPAIPATPTPEEKTGQEDRPATVFAGEYLVFLSRGGKVEARAVTTGLTDFDYTAILSGLTPGDSVVVLPTSGALEDEQRRQQWIQRRVAGPLSGSGR